MTRPRRAAAARASKAWKSQTKSDSNPDPITPSDANLTPNSPPRRVRRSSKRSAKRASCSLSRRRAEFDRIVARHISTVRAASTPSLPSSALTELPSDGSENLLDEVSLSPSFAQRVLDADADEADVLMRALLLKLRDMDQKGEKLEHEADVGDIRGLAEVLSGERFILHDSGSTKLLTACALAELLRISAPDPLISSQKLSHVCSLFIDQLTVLVVENEGMEAFRFSLLEQLSTVKTFVIFAHESELICDLFACFYAISRPHQPSKVREYFADILVSVLDEADELNRDILDALLAPLVPSLRYSSSAVRLAEIVLSNAANIVQVSLCSMLNASIRQFRHQKSVITPEKPRRRTPVKKDQPKVEVPQNVEVSEHHEHVADLLVAINTVAPDILIYVIPSLEDRIRASDNSVRLANVHLLGRLFRSRQDMAESYPSLFTEFLARIRDVSPNIRAEVCAALVGLIASHPKHREKLNELLRDRLLDRDEEVRVVAVRSVGESLDFADDELLKLMSSRLRDRKPSVRAEALKQLTEMYIDREGSRSKDSTASLTPQFEEGDTLNKEGKEPSQREDFGEENEEQIKTPLRDGQMEYSEGTSSLSLSWLPQTLLQTHIALRGAEDVALANEIEKVIFVKIPGSRSDASHIVDARLRRFAFFLANLDNSAYSHLVQLAGERQKCRDSLMRIAEYRLQSKRRPTSITNSSGSGPKTFSGRKSERDVATTANLPPVDVGEIHELSKWLSRFFHGGPGSRDDVHTLCLAVSSAVDLRIYEKILRVLDWKSTFSERVGAQQDAVSRVGSKTRAGIFLQNDLFPKCLPGIFTPLYLSRACRIAVDESKSNNQSHEEKDADRMVENFSMLLCGILRYLDLAGKLAPSLTGHAFESVKSLVSIPLNEMDSSTDVILVGLKLISHLPSDVLSHGNTASIGKLVRSWMLAKRVFNVEQTTNLAKWSARAAVRLHSAEAEEQSSFLHKLTKEICSQIDLFRGNAEEILAPITSLTQLAKHSPNAFKPFALESFDFARALLHGSLNEKLRSFSRHDDSIQNSQHNRNQTLSRRSSPHSVSEQDAFSLLDMVTDFHVAVLVELIHRAVKLLVYALSFVDSKDEELNNVFKTLLHVLLQKNGDVFDFVDSGRIASAGDVDDVDDRSVVSESVSTMCAISRLSAGRGLLYLARHPTFFRCFSPHLLVSTMLLAQDEQPHVRMAFAKIVFNQIHGKRLPFRWIVALPLMAVDPVRKNVSQVRTMLTTLFRHRRRIFERAKLESSPSSSMQLLPEAAVPELIWVLANLPEVELDQEADFAESEKCIELMLERLLESNDYAGVLNEFIEGLSIAQDITEREDDSPGVKTERIHVLGRMASAILKKKQAGKKWNLSQHPGRVSLPKDMFRVINREAETSGVHPPSLIDVARLYDSDRYRLSAKKEKPQDIVTRVMSATPVRSLPFSEHGSIKKAVEQGSHFSPATDAVSSPPAPSMDQKENTETSPGEGLDSDRMEVETRQGATKDLERAPNGSDKRRKKRPSSELDDGSPNSTEPKIKTRCASKETEVEGNNDSKNESAQRIRPISRQNLKNKSHINKDLNSVKVATEKPIVRRSRRLRKV